VCQVLQTVYESKSRPCKPCTEPSVHAPSRDPVYIHDPFISFQHYRPLRLHWFKAHRYQSPLLKPPELSWRYRQTRRWSPDFAFVYSLHRQFARLLDLDQQAPHATDCAGNRLCCRNPPQSIACRIEVRCVAAGAAHISRLAQHHRLDSGWQVSSSG
jgi:hypothetical protein